MATGQIVRGLSDLAVFVLGAADAPGSKVDVPGARAFDVSVDSDSDELEGDDTIIAVAYGSKKGSGSMEMGKANLTARAAMLGGTVTTSGTTPNEVSTWDEPAGANQIWVKISAQAKLADVAGGAYQVDINKAKAGGSSESFGQSAWNTPSLDFSFVESSAGKFITRKLQETLVALA